MRILIEEEWCLLDILTVNSTWILVCFFDGIKFCYKITNRKTLDYFYSLLELIE